MSKKAALITFSAVVLTAILAVYMATAPSLLQGPENGTAGFSASNAYQHLQEITRAPHSLGTPEDQRVREYIVNSCRQMGLSTEIQHGLSLASWGPAVAAGNVYNVIARLKGRTGGKAVLVAAHYDSQPNAYGAGDDGAGVAAMLEVAHILRSGQPLEHDVIFLFTDGEEAGMLGADVFVKESPLMKEVGVVLNFEGRGNAGISTMFETNPGNGWVVREYARSAAHPFANSLNYEVYKSLPNNTDYSLFKQAGVAGLNNAYIEGFVNYHSMTDRAENLDMNSFQDHGDNMLSLVRHFANIDLNRTRAPDMTYFNVIGDWLLMYPASWNLVLLILGDLALLYCIVLGFVRRSISVKGFFVGLMWYVLLLAILFFASEFILSMLRKAYPLYDNFYASNSYNAYYYFFALSAFAVAVFGLLYQWVIRTTALPDLIAAVLLIVGLAMNALFIAAPSALYLLFFPLVSGLGIWQWKKGAAGRFAFALPGLLLMPPVVYYLFVAFGLTASSAFAIVILALLLGLLLPVLEPLLKIRRWFIPGLAFLLVLGSLCAAHIQSGYHEKAPLQTNLRYVLDADKKKAFWVSEFLHTDSWNRQFFAHPREGYAAGGLGRSLVNDAPVASLPVPVLNLVKDTSYGGLRRLRLHYQPAAGVLSARIMLTSVDSVAAMLVSGKEAPPMQWTRAYQRRLEYMGVPAEGFDLEFWLLPETDPSRKFSLEVVSRSLGLTGIPGFKGYDAGVIPGPNGNSNTVQIVKSYSF